MQTSHVSIKTFFDVSLDVLCIRYNKPTASLQMDKTLLTSVMDMTLKLMLTFQYCRSFMNAKYPFIDTHPVPEW